MENKSLLVCSGSVHKNAVDHTERWRRVEVTIFSSPFLVMDVDLAVPQRLSFNTHGWWSIIIHHQIHRPPPLLANLFNLISESLSDCQNQRSIKKINKSPAKPLSCKFFPHCDLFARTAFDDESLWLPTKKPETRGAQWNGSSMKRTFRWTFAPLHLIRNDSLNLSQSS